jgi:hypothetical protein
MRFRTAVPPLVALLLSSGCAIFSQTPDAAQVSAELARAEAERAAGDDQAAVARLLHVRKVSDLDPALRDRSADLLESAAQALMDHYEASGTDPDTFEELFEEQGLPTHVRARAGILAADRDLARGERIAAVKLVKRVDQELPGHANRIPAGDVLARAGLALIHDPSRYGLFFTYRARGVSALEYLIQHYPLDAHCPAALAALAERYEREDDLDLAIERHEDLVLYHDESPEAVVSEARLPYLRLERLERNDYDRHELLRARAELARWLERHPSHELEPWVRGVALECDRRLTENDLILAAYYRRTGAPFGTRIHCERALRRAQEAGLAELASRAREGLAALPAASPQAETALPEAELELPPREGTRP